MLFRSVGAAGTAIAHLLVLSGATHIIGFDRKGAITRERESNDPMRQWFMDHCNPNQFDGTLSEAMIDADIFIGVSAPNVLVEGDIKAMASNAIVFALSNPDPEIDPAIARRFAAVVATGRSDQPNQINNVLAFPGIFRGLLDSGATEISDVMLLNAAKAISECVSTEQLNNSYIIPSVFDSSVVNAVATSVHKTVSNS